MLWRLGMLLRRRVAALRRAYGLGNCGDDRKGTKLLMGPNVEKLNDWMIGTTCVSCEGGSDSSASGVRATAWQVAWLAAATNEGVQLWTVPAGWRWPEQWARAATWLLRPPGGGEVRCHLHRTSPWPWPCPCPCPRP